MSVPHALMPVSEALEAILAQVRTVPDRVEAEPDAALGGILRESQPARINVPAYDNSAMDGFALCLADLETNTVLRVSQTIAAGHPGAALEPGTAARIFTGAPLPDGADTVVIQENAEYSAGRVSILKVPAKGQNVRRRGHDIKAGSTVLAAGHRLRPQDLGLLASLGMERVSITRPLQVAVINTGDEVISPGRELKPGQLYDSNSFTLEGMLTRLGCRVRRQGVVADTREATVAALEKAAGDADCIITTGGVSVGDEDHVRAAVETLGALSLWKLAIKPGKPFSFGRVGNVPFFGLPGNPVAVFVTFAMLVRPYLLKMLGAASLMPPRYPVKAGFSVEQAGSRQEYLRVRLETGADGQAALMVYPNQGSSILTSLSWADGLAVVPARTEVVRGDELDYYPFDGLI